MEGLGLILIEGLHIKSLMNIFDGADWVMRMANEIAESAMPPERGTISYNGGILRPFKPGQSGNPGGKSKLEGEMMRRCREASAEVADFLVGVALGRVVEANIRERIVASNMVLDRAWGKVKELPPEEPDKPNEQKTAEQREFRALLFRLLSDRHRHEHIKIPAKFRESFGLEATATETPTSPPAPETW